MNSQCSEQLFLSYHGISVFNICGSYRVPADCENGFDELKVSMGSGAYSTQNLSADLLEFWQASGKMRCKIVSH